MGFMRSAQLPALHNNLHRGQAASSSSTASRRCQLVLLDDRRLDVTLTGRTVTADLLDLVAAHCGISERKHFGIAFQSDTGDNHWLHSDVHVLEHDLPRTGTPLLLYFLVRYFPESFRQLSDPLAVELVYQQVKNLIFKGELDAEDEGELDAEDEVFHLAALSLQASYGDYTDDMATRHLLKRTALLPAGVIKLHPSVGMCEERVIVEYGSLVGTSRGSAVVTYLSVAEKLPSYGIHYYPVLDRVRVSCWLGISSRGIAQYPLNDRSKPKRLFAWKHLENVTFRDKRFSIEVDEPKKVVHTLSSFNVYEEAISSGCVEPAAATPAAAAAAGFRAVDDDLISAISQPNTQVSVSRRTLGPGHISVYSWFAGSQSACRNVWLTAVSLHQYHVDSRKDNRAASQPPHQRPLSEVAADLSAICSAQQQQQSRLCAAAAGSSHSSSSSLSGSVASLSCTEELRAARAEMAAALLARRQALEAQLLDRTGELRLLCIREAELTGRLPDEMPLQPGEQPPVIRRRMGTSFTLSETLLDRLHGNQEEMVAALELDLEIQRKITTAALKLANDATLKKTIRKQRKLSYQMSAQKLKEMEVKLKAARNKQKKAKKPRPSSDGEDHHTEDEDSVESADAGLRCAQYCSTLPPRPHQHTHQPPPLRHRQQQQIYSADSDLLVGLDSSSSCRAARSAPASPKLPPKSQSAIFHHLQPSQHHSLRQQRHHPTSRNPSPAPTGYSSSSAVGYVPTTVYTRSSYRSKQYPTLSGPQHRSRSSDSQQRHLFDSQDDDAIVPPPAEYWTPSGAAGMYSVPERRASAVPVHHLSVDELESVEHEMDVTPLEAGSAARYGSLGRRGVAAALQPLLLTATPAQCWPPPPQPPRFTDSPLSVASDALRTGPATHARSGHLPGAEAGGGRRRSEKGWYETSVDAPEVAARRPAAVPEEISPTPLVAPPRRTTAVAPPPPVVPLESAATPRLGAQHRLQQPPPAPPSPAPPPPLKSPTSPIPAESPVNQTLIKPGSYQPYRETSKPFEMADFYKYSTRYRRSGGPPVESPSPGGSSSSGSCSSSSLPSPRPPAAAAVVVSASSPPWSGGGCSPGGSLSSCGSSSGSVHQAATLYTHQAALSPHRGLYQPPSPQTCVPAAKPQQQQSPYTANHNSSFHLPADSVADSFHAEMINWYDGGGARKEAPPPPGAGTQTRAATLV